MQPQVTICKQMRMAAAHRLPFHNGKCQNLHGHSYMIEIYVTGPVQPVEPTNPQSGMVVDFGTIKDFLIDVERLMDHTYLNNEPIAHYPTAENLALWILGKAQRELELPAGARVSKVRVYEEYVTPQASAEVEAPVEAANEGPCS